MGVAPLTVVGVELVSIQGEIVFVGCQFGIVGRLQWECVFGESGSIFLDTRVVGLLRLVDTLLHAVSGILSNGQRAGRELLARDGGEATDIEGGGCLFQTQPQLTFLEIEELAAAVGGAGHEVIERLVILYQIGVDKL